MPFERYPTLEPNPSIKIFFIGLNILAPTDDKGCQAFVHNSSPHHNLSIEVRRKRPGKPDMLMMRHHGPLAFTGADETHTHGLLILTTRLEEEDKGVKAYDETVASTEGTTLFDSFSLKNLLGEVPEVSPFGGLPSIFIDDGIFYTASKVTVEAKIVKNNKEEIPLSEVPTIIGANIYLDPEVPEHEVTLFWRQQGTDVHLPLRPSPNFTYEIYVINEPLFEDDSAEGPRHGEFAEYFKLLPGVQHEDKFELVFVGDIPERGSTRTPCMSILLSD